jgi:hypothetical protein
MALDQHELIFALSDLRAMESAAGIALQIGNTVGLQSNVTLMIAGLIYV